MQALEDEGLVRGRDSEGRRVYELTEPGRARADEGQLRDLAAADCSRSSAGAGEKRKTRDRNASRPAAAAAQASAPGGSRVRLQADAPAGVGARARRRPGRVQDRGADGAR